MTYWDASSLVPLVIKEATTALYLRIAQESGVTTWWGSYVECVAAITRHAQQGNAMPQVAESYRLLEQLSEEWAEMGANEQLRRAAARAAKQHNLRSGDAFQLGAAMIASRFEPHDARFLTRDPRLKKAAEREGFVVD